MGRIVADESLPEEAEGLDTLLIDRLDLKVTGDFMGETGVEALTIVLLLRFMEEQIYNRYILKI